MSKIDYECMCGHKKSDHEYETGLCKTCVCRGFVDATVYLESDKERILKQVAWVLEQCFMEGTHDGCMIMFPHRENQWWKFLMGLKSGELLPVICGLKSKQKERIK